MNPLIKEPAPIEATPTTQPQTVLKAVSEILSPEDGHLPRLRGRWPCGEEFDVSINQRHFVIGRVPDADLVVPPNASFVSGRHLEIQQTPVGYALVDLESTNGTRRNNLPIAPLEAVPLTHGDIIRIGSAQNGSSIGFSFFDPNAATAAQNGFQTMVGQTTMLNVARVTIGRDPDNDIVLNVPTVARRHAVIQQHDADHHLIKALDGHRVILNGQAIQIAPLQVNDMVQIGPYLLTYDGTLLVQYASHGYRMDVVDLYKEVRGKQGKLRLLDEISLTVLPREFVALVGGSGAGKSTLLDALNGFRPAKGQVLINGRDLYAHYDEFRAQMGYVPQYDILPMNLTVDAALTYAAKLRLASDVSAQERAERITRALDTVEMNSERIRSTRISQLSGGQRKRVSIAAELLADPKIFFLDEPASGLDPGLEKKLMYTLRKMADEGRTVIMITHATDNIMQVDDVAFLAQGKLIYYGPPAATLEYFDVQEFADIYEKIEQNGDAWRHTFTMEKPSAYRQYVVGRQRSRPRATNGRAKRPGFMRQLRQGRQQFAVLCQRMMRQTVSDPIALFVRLGVMPLVAVLSIISRDAADLIGDSAIISDVTDAATRLTESYLPALNSYGMIFGMALLALLAGAFGGSQELLRERTIYQRERMVNLGLLPYISSKLVVFAFFALIQVILYLLVLGIGMDLPTDGVLLAGPVELAATLFLAVMAGIATGLLISSLSSTSTVAVYLVLIFVFFQYIFGGVNPSDADFAASPLNHAAAMRPATLAIGTTTNMVELADAAILCGPDFTLDASDVVFDPTTGALALDSLKIVETDGTRCTNVPQSTDNPLPYGTTVTDLLGFWGQLLGLIALFTVGTVLSVKRLDWK